MNNSISPTGNTSNANNQSVGGVMRTAIRLRTFTPGLHVDKSHLRSRLSLRRWLDIRFQLKLGSRFYFVPELCHGLTLFFVKRLIEEGTFGQSIDLVQLHEIHHKVVHQRHGVYV